MKRDGNSLDGLIDFQVAQKLFGEPLEYWTQSPYQPCDVTGSGEPALSPDEPVYGKIFSVPVELYEMVGEEEYETLTEKFSQRCKTMLREKLGADAAFSLTTERGINVIWLMLSPAAYEALKNQKMAAAESAVTPLTRRR